MLAIKIFLRQYDHFDVQKAFLNLQKFYHIQNRKPIRIFPKIRYRDI